MFIIMSSMGKALLVILPDVKDIWFLMCRDRQPWYGALQHRPQAASGCCDRIQLDRHERYVFNTSLHDPRAVALRPSRRREPSDDSLTVKSRVELQPIRQSVSSVRYRKRAFRR